MTALSDKRAGDAFSAAFGGQRGRLDADKLSARHPTVHARALLADKLAGGAVRDDLIAELYQHRYQREGLPLIAELFEQTVSSLARSCRTTFHKRAEALLAASGLRDEYSRTAYELPLTTRMLYRRATGEFEQNPALTHVWEQGDRSHLPGFGRTVQFACGLEGAIDPTCRVRRDIVAARARAWKTDPVLGSCLPGLRTGVADDAPAGHEPVAQAAPRGDGRPGQEADC